MTAKWGIYHSMYGFLSANSIQIVYTNDLAISRINGLGFVPTRAMAYTVLKAMRAFGAELEGYSPKQAEIIVRPIVQERAR